MALVNVNVSIEMLTMPAVYLLNLFDTHLLENNY